MAAPKMSSESTPVCEFTSAYANLCDKVLTALRDKNLSRLEYETYPSKCVELMMNNQLRSNNKFAWLPDVVMRKILKYAKPLAPESMFELFISLEDTSPATIVSSIVSFKPHDATERSDTIAEIATRFSKQWNHNATFSESRMMVNPFALLRWLSLATSRKYTAARLLRLTVSDSDMDKIENAPHGFEKPLFPRGVYFSLQDSSCAHRSPWNNDVMCLLLCPSSYRLPACSLPEADITRFHLPGGYDSCIFVHNPDLVLPLGRCKRMNAVQ